MLVVTVWNFRYREIIYLEHLFCAQLLNLKIRRRVNLTLRDCRPTENELRPLVRISVGLCFLRSKGFCNQRCHPLGFLPRSWDFRSNLGFLGLFLSALGFFLRFFHRPWAFLWFFHI